jgi:hypothetical protein
LADTCDYIKVVPKAAWDPENCSEIWPQITLHTEENRPMREKKRQGQIDAAFRQSLALISVFTKKQEEILHLFFLFCKKG